MSRHFPPRCTSEPSGRTTSSPRTCVVVNPYFRQCAPPEFSATLPPMLQTDCDDGAEFLKNARVHGRLSGNETLSPAAGVPQSSLPHQCTNVKPCGMNCGKT